MSLLNDLKDYFTKNGGLNTVTGTLIPTVLQVATVVDPSFAEIIKGAFTPEVSSMMLSGGVAAWAAGLIIVARIFLAVRRKGQPQ